MYTLSEEYGRIIRKEHHKEDGTFRNMWETWVDPMVFVLIKYFVTLQIDLNKLLSRKNLENIDIDLPILKPDCDELPERKEEIKYTWIGHSTFLIQTNGKTILTDPVFADRASPSQWVGPKRYRKVPMKIKDIKTKIDIVVYSHNHFDHLDQLALKDIEEHEPIYFVPLKFSSLLTTYNVPQSRIVELDWFETYELDNEFKFTFLPTQHWSNRSFNDKYHSLWGCWLINTGFKKIFFSGDTAYCSIFKDIGHLYGPIDLSFIAIGAYGTEKTRPMLKTQHINSQEAFDIANDIGSIRSVGCHWGTFALTDEPILEPRSNIYKLVELNEKPKDFFTTMSHGQTLII